MLNKFTLSLFLLLALLVPLSAFPQPSTDSKPAKSLSVTGKLTRAMAVGGESTGWSIELDSEITVDGHKTKSIEVQGPMEKLEPLADKHVSARRHLVTLESPERGKRTVLNLTRIRELVNPPNLY
jgi:hypothetical protein